MELRELFLIVESGGTDNIMELSFLGKVVHQNELVGYANELIKYGNSMSDSRSQEDLIKFDDDLDSAIELIRNREYSIFQIDNSGRLNTV